MTDEQIRTCIAEACGWKKVGHSLAGLGGFPPAGYEKHPLPSPEAHPQDWRIRDGYHPGEQWFTLPDYLNDLNAMHEAEAFAMSDLMDSDQWEEYGKHLETYHPSATLLTGESVDYHEFATLMHSTARQRAEAFLRTLGLWEEPTGH